MTQILIDIARSTINSSTDFVELTGVTYAKFAEAAGSMPGSLEVYAIVSSTLDPDAPGTPGRLQPAQQIRLSFFDAASNAYVPVFMGRIDTATQVDAPGSTPVSLSSADNSGQRQWHIFARDWLAVLADNYVQPGKWRSSTITNRNVPGVTGADPWNGNYVGNYTRSRPDAPGEQRVWIVADLCLNIVNSTSFGVDNQGNGLIDFVVPLGEGPNSKPIVANLSTLTQTKILDAIRDLTRSEPWDTAHGPLVDGRDIANNNFPSSAGFGSELHIMPLVTNTRAAFGRTVEYYRYGQINSGCIFAYPPLITSGATAFITEYDFSRQGLDIYSRVRPAGQGDGTYARPDTNDGGQGVNLPAMESVWDPLNGNFAKRAEALSFSDSLIGDWMYEESQSTSYDAIQARAQRDAAYADLVSGAAALSSQRGGLSQGRFTIAGPPADSNGTHQPITHILRPGELVQVTIPQIGLNNTGQDLAFVIQQFVYEWPLDKTQIIVARLPMASVGAQLVDFQRRINESITARGKMYISPWRASDPTGVMSWNHSLGTKPGSIVVEVGHWDGSTHVAGSTTIPLPTSGTHVAAPATTWDAAQGQTYGYVLTKADEQQVTVNFGYFIAFSDDVGSWMTRTDPNTLVRVKVYPT